MSDARETPGTPEDQIIASLFLMAEQTRLPHEPVYDKQDEEAVLRRFGDWLDDNIEHPAGTVAERDEEREYVEFAKEHMEPLYRYLRRLGAEPTLAQDVTQDTLVRAHAHWSKIRLYGEDPRKWLYKVAAQQLRQMQAKTMEDPAPGVSFDLLQDRPHPSRVDEWAADRVLIQAAIAGLPLHQKMAMALLMEGYSMREIAEILAVSPRVVVTTLRRVRERLAKNLERDRNTE